jgi:hypothetical protein
VALLVVLSIAIDTDVAALYLCLEESIFHFGFCYLHQNRFPDHSLYYIEYIVFVVSVIAVLVVAADLCVLDNHVAR